MNTTKYLIERADGRFLTPKFLQWTSSPSKAQKCDKDEAKAIKGWLKHIGIQVIIQAA